MARDVENPWTQVVVVKAERGVGKTRLALEFYRWLAQHEDAAGAQGYWPDRVALLDRNIDVNPDPEKCRFETPIPFLWWGLRGADTQVENAFAGDAVSSYDRFLAPHLVALTIRARMLGSGREILDIWRDVAKGELASWTGYDTVMAVGEGLLKTVSIVTGNLRDTREAGAPSAGEKRQVDRVDAVLEELESVFNPNAFSYARTPGVILIDDAQFSTGDSSLAHFTERLMHTAVAQSWPVMILVTHWRRELAPDFAKTERSFAAILHHALGTSRKSGGDPDVAGGYLHSTNYLEIDLPPVADLSAALAEDLPGLTPEQAGALLDHAGGNPRHLEQIITFLRENEDFFEEFDTSRALTEEGLEEALEETHDIFKVVLRRLRDAPAEVQEAVCIASTLGIRFVSDIVEDIMKAHLGHDTADALSRASDPYSMIRTDESRQLAEFAERLFFLVAERRRKSLKSLSDRDGLDSALKRALQARLSDAGYARQADPQALALTYNLAARTFGRDGEDRDLAMIALGRLAALESARYSHRAALDAAHRFHALFREAPESAEVVGANDISTVAALLREEGRPDDAIELLRPLSDHFRDLAEREESLDALQDLSVSLGDLGRAHEVAGNHAAALKAFEEALSLQREVVQASDTPESLRGLLTAMDGMGVVATTLGDHATARALYEEMHAGARDLAERLGTPESQKDLAITLDNLGRAAAIVQDHDAAMENFQQSLRLRRDLADQLKTRESLQNLSISVENIGRSAWALGDFATADRSFEECLRLRRDLAQESGTPEAINSFAGALFNHGHAARNNGDMEAASAAFTECLSLWRGLADRLKTPESRRFLADALNAVGWLNEDLGHREAAEAAFRECLELRRDLAETTGTPESFRLLAKSLFQSGQAAREAGDVNAATSALAECLSLRRDLAGRLKTPESHRDLADALDATGSLHEEQGNREAAAQARKECLDLRRDLAETSRTPEDMRELALSLRKYGELSASVGAVQAALAAFDECLSLRRDLVARRNSPENRRDLCIILYVLGEFHSDNGDHSAALAYVHEGQTLTHGLSEPLKSEATELFDVLQDGLRKQLNAGDDPTKDSSD